MIVVLLGPPGAGKGTQAKMLAQATGAVHLSSGDILRAERAAGTDLGKQVAEYMDRGELVPDDLIIKIMLNRIGEAAGRHVLLDGFPRTVVQAEALEQALAEKGLKVELALNIVVPDAEIERRLTGRRSCPVCGAVYHVEFAPPRNDNRCDRDGAELVIRSDDIPEVVRKRLAAYHEQTSPLVDYYKNRGVLREVDGTQSPEAVQAAIKAVLAEAASA